MVDIDPAPDATPPLAARPLTAQNLPAIVALLPVPDATPPLPARPLTAQDLPVIVAALPAAVGATLQRIVANAQGMAAELVGVLTRMFDGSLLLDILAEVADRGLVWAGSEEGQQRLEAIDIAFLAVEIADFYGHASVYRPLSHALMREALDEMQCHGPHDSRRLLRAVGPDSANWSWIREGLLESPAMRERREQIADAFECIEHGVYGPAVTTLLPVFEGVISDKAGILERMRVGLRLEEVLQGRSSVTPDGFGDLIARPALTVIDQQVFAHRDFVDVRIDDGDLNRHAILHGRTTGYRTREHALRALMLLVALAELLDGPIMYRATLPPAADPALADDYGVLTGLREAGATRVATGTPAWRADRLIARHEAHASLPPG